MKYMNERCTTRHRVKAFEFTIDAINTTNKVQDIYVVVLTKNTSTDGNHLYSNKAFDCVRLMFTELGICYSFSFNQRLNSIFV